MEKQSKDRLDKSLVKFKENPLISKAIKEKLNEKTVTK